MMPSPADPTRADAPVPPVPFAGLRRHGFAVRYLTLFGGEAFSKVCVMVAFAYLARALGPRDFGIIELALSIAVFFVLGVESGMGSYGARMVAARPEEIPTLIPRVMLLRTLFSLPAYVIVVLVAAHYRVAGLGILAINGLTVLLTPFSVQWVFQGLRQMQLVAIGTALRNLGFVALIFLLVRPGSDLRLVAVAEVGAATALAIFNIVVLIVRLRVRIDWRGVVGGAGRLFHEVWYLGASDLAWACLWYSPVIVMGWIAMGHPEQVAWVAASVRIVVALHTFVYLYFFNLLPNLARELTVSLDEWRALVGRSIAASMWPACLVSVGGTLIAPVLIRIIYGPEYGAAVRPFQIVVWMIPVVWLSGHFRFSLIAAGHQRSESFASAVMAGVTGMVVGAIFLSSVHLQSVLGASPFVAGLEFLPLAAAITLGAMVASKVIGRAGPRPLILVGLVVMAAGVLLLAANAHGTSYAANVLPGFLLTGAGVGPMFVAIAVAAMADVPGDKAGLASGLMMTGHEVGAALGVAALTAVAGDLTSRTGLVDGYGHAFMAAAVVLAALFVLTLVAVPGGRPTAGTHGHHGGHGGHGGHGH
jgi:O-antigen/teichoic acid export membrane protein